MGLRQAARTGACSRCVHRLTTWFIERHRGRRDALSKIADGLREDLRAVQQLAVEYWSRESRADDAVIEARMVAYQLEIGAALRLLQHEMDAAIVVDPNVTIADLADALTGGDFQVAGRQADPARITQCARALSRLRFDVAGARLRNLKRVRGD
jgi:hypothetical protein